MSELCLSGEMAFRGVSLYRRGKYSSLHSLLLPLVFTLDAVAVGCPSPRSSLSELLDETLIV